MCEQCSLAGNKVHCGGTMQFPKFISGFNRWYFSMIDDVLIDSEASMMTSSISRITDSAFEGARRVGPCVLKKKAMEFCMWIFHLYHHLSVFLHGKFSYFATAVFSFRSIDLYLIFNLNWRNNTASSLYLFIRPFDKEKRKSCNFPSGRLGMRDRMWTCPSLFHRLIKQV
jgi:hypothetical protein